MGKPIAFASTGEKLDDFELFHPDRLAGRILGMGDVLTLIEKAEEVYEKDEAEEAAARLLEGTFTLDDFLDQMQQLKKMGPLSGLLGMLPGMPKELKDAEIDDEQIARVEAIIRSMTPAERADARPHRRLPPGPHRQRLGHRSPARSASCVKQFKEMQKMMKRMPGRLRHARRARAARARRARRAAVGGRTAAGPRRGHAHRRPSSPSRCPGLQLSRARRTTMVRRPSVRHT